MLNACVFRKVSITLGVLVIMLGLTPPAWADTIDLYSIQDTEITGRAVGSSVNTHNWGGLLYLTGNVNRTDGPTSAVGSALYFPNFGDSRGLFKFDLSSIPAGSTIDSATVSLYIGFNAFSPISSRITSVSLYQATSAWTEIGATYDTRPTWSTAQVTSMTIPAGTGAGGKIPFNGYINGNIAGLVQAWLDGDAQNYGLVTSDTYTTAGLLRIYAREAGGTAQDPRLRVTYTPPPPPPVSVPDAGSSFALLTLGVTSLVAIRRRLI